MKQPHHITLSLEEVRNNLCDPDDVNWRVCLTGLPLGLITVFSVGPVGSRHIDHWEAGSYTDISQIISTVRDADDKAQSYLYKSDARQIRELRLWFDINHEQLEEQWFRWRSWDLRRQIQELQEEYEKHDSTTQFIEAELAKRVADAAEEARLAQL